MPLKHLVKEKIDTHLLAFEIYFRKGEQRLLFLSCPPLFSQLKCFFSFSFREIHVNAAVSQTSLGHRAGPPVAAPVSSSLFQRRYEGLSLFTRFPQMLRLFVGDEICLSFFLSTPFFFSPVSESKELPEVVRTVLKQEITRLFGDSNARSFNQAYLSKHSNSIPHRLAGRPHTRSLCCCVAGYLLMCHPTP